jgi:CysZ protein
VIEDSLAAFFQIFTPPFRAVLAKSLALTLVLLALAGFGLDRFAVSFSAGLAPWLATLIGFLVGLGLIVGLAFLIGPVVSLVAGFFFDEMAAIVERDVDPDGAPGRAAPAGIALLFGLRFAGLSILVNLIALALLFAPGVNLVAFLGANAYLLGREYFELAAMRFRPAADARAMRRRHALIVFLAGLVIALFVSIPLLNLCAPLFATALMVRLHKRLAAGEAPLGR